MTSILKNTKISKKEKNINHLKVCVLILSFFIFKVIISDWECFKAGLFGTF
ncbi:hypothetical protein H9I45_04420 [Polaribacter haliotis]|uniref:Uncharacterized protein n=1 Tax=Polaribacter haliotis TaxID=1888915 RepID=A0A7L8AI58_9FLAO|nr:hypothetical protein [Polaribacter haliotis]QOD61700.1 hypothetical protein H9I45_04420 [Polaribacter haliotis]